MELDTLMKHSTSRHSDHIMDVFLFLQKWENKGIDFLAYAGDVLAVVHHHRW